VEHTELPLEAVQFHPESIMTLGEEIGIRLIRNAVTNAMGSRATTVPAAHS
jgi:anthranilate synthase